MGTIKDVTDLTIELINSVKDRKLTAKITAIQSLIATFQSEHFSVIEKNTQLLTENFASKQKISELEKQILELKSTHAKQILELKEKHKQEINNINNDTEGDFVKGAFS